MRWRLFLLGWLGPALFVNPAGNMSSDSVLATAAAVVERREFTISPSAGTVLSRVGQEFHNGTAPGAWALAVPIYAVLRPLLAALPPAALPDRAGPAFAFRPPLELPPERFWLRLLMVWLVMAPLAGLFAAMSAQYARKTPGSSALLNTSWAIATPLLCYACTYSRQGLAALLVAVALLLRLTGRASSRGAASGLGAMLALAVAVDYGAAPAVAAVGAYLLLSAPRGSSLAFLIGGAIPLLALGAFHWRVYGGPLLTPYHFRIWPLGTGVWYRGEFVDFARAQAEARGGLGLGWPDLRSAATLLLSPGKGLLLFCPLLVAGLYGHWRALREPGRRPLAACMLAAFALQFAFVSGLRGELYQGGFPIFYGPRYLLALIAPTALGLAALRAGRPSARVAAGLLPLSAAVALLGAMYQDRLMNAGADWSSPMHLNPIGDFASRLVSEGPRVPLLDAYGAPGWAQAITVAGYAFLALWTARVELKTSTRS